MVARALRRTMRWTPVALVGMGLAACGGGQRPAAPVAEERPVTQEEARPATRETRRELTPAEREAERVQRRDSLFAEAVALYTDVPPASRDLPAIEARLRQALELEPGSPDLWFNLGTVLWERGEHAAARQAWERAGEVDPAYARGLASLSFAALSAGEMETAAVLLEQCLERRAVEPGCNINRSILLTMRAFSSDTPDLRLAQEAVDHIRFALLGEGRISDAYATLARIYYELGRLELARLVCETAIVLGMEDPALHNRLGLVALREDDVIRARQEFERAIELDPGFVDARLNVGAMALSFRDYETARTHFGYVLERDASHWEALLAHGVALRGLGDLPGAEAAYDRVLTADPRHLGALLNKGLLYQEFLEDYPTAITWYERFLEAGGAAHPRGDEVRQRIRVLRELIEIMQEMSQAPRAGALAWERP